MPNRRTVTIEMNAGLLDEARVLDIDIDNVVEAALRQAIRIAHGAVSPRSEGGVRGGPSA